MPGLSSIRSSNGHTVAHACIAGLLAGGCGGGGASDGDASGSSGSADSTTVVDPTAVDSSGPADTSTTDPSTSATTVMTTTPNPECGNGVLEDPEQCDDGNLRGGDGCDVDCTETVDTTLWTDIVPGGAAVEEAAQAVAFDSAGNVIVVGWITEMIALPDLWVRKYSPAGDPLWTQALDLSSGFADRGFGVAIGADDTIAVVGVTGVSINVGDIWIGKLDPDGATLWSQTVDGPAGDNDAAHGVAVDDSGNLWVTGFVRVGIGDDDIWVGKYDGDGNQLSTDIIAGPSDLEDHGQGVAVDADGNAFVVGYLSDEGFAGDVWLRKYAPEGTATWTSGFDSQNHGIDEGYGVAVAPDGSVGVAGFTALTAINEDVWLGRFGNEDGVLIWQKKFGGPAVRNDHGLAIATDSANAFIVAGFKGVDDVDTDIWVRKWDDGGNVAWTQSFPGAGTNRDLAFGVAVDGNDDIAVVGEIRQLDDNNGDIWVAKLGGTP
jgi:cysteine-rich repeat protein